MELLEAVNTVLPHLGEHVVTIVEGARHPTVDLIVKAIERHRKVILAAGWWFNEAHRTLTPNRAGQIDAPTNMIAIYGVDGNVAIDGDRLFDLDNDTRYFEHAIRVKIIKDIPFERLPYTMAMFIIYRVAAEVYTADYGVDNTTNYLSTLASQHYTAASQENMRNRRYNSVDNNRHFNKYRRYLHR